MLEQSSLSTFMCTVQGCCLFTVLVPSCERARCECRTRERVKSTKLRSDAYKSPKYPRRLLLGTWMSEKQGVLWTKRVRGRLSKIVSLASLLFFFTPPHSGMSNRCCSRRSPGHCAPVLVLFLSVSAGKTRRDGYGSGKASKTQTRDAERRPLTLLRLVLRSHSNVFKFFVPLVRA